jgi:hypothetical protein
MIVARIAKTNGTMAAENAPKHADRRKEFEFLSGRIGVETESDW